MFTKCAQTRIVPNRSLPHFSRKDLSPEVGLAVRDERKGKNLTQKELALAANILPHTLARIERGEHKPRQETLRAIADALMVRLELLAPEWTVDEQRRRNRSDLHLGIGLRKARLAAGISLETAAAAAGVHPATLSRFERMQTDSLMLSDDGETIKSESLARVLGYDSIESLSAACSDFFW